MCIFGYVVQQVSSIQYKNTECNRHRHSGQSRWQNSVFFFKPTVFLGFINFDILLLLKLFFRHFTKKEAIKVTNIVRNSKQVQTNINTNYR